MNDKELKYIFKEWKQFLSWCYENNDKTIEIYIDKIKYVMDYTNKLQSNWNSLKEIIKDLGIDYLLDKMNELEGKDKE